MTIETKEIGIDTGIGIGTFHNTEYVDGAIRLKQINTNKIDTPIYEMEGYWESEVIDLVDKFKEYDTVALARTQEIRDVYSIETRVSDDGINFDEYQATTPESRVQSTMKRYIQVRINFFAGMNEEEYAIVDFNSSEDKNEWDNNEFIETDGSLKLKKDYEFSMNSDESWADEGVLHRKKIVRSEWKKIDSIGIE